MRFYIPASARWQQVRKQAAGLGERITDTLRTIARENPDLAGVIDRRGFNATEGNQRLLDDNTLARLVSILSEQRLPLSDMQPDLLGAYEYLIRKFAERGSSAGEFFTPTDVGFLSPASSAQPGEASMARPAAPAGCSSRRNCATARS